MSSLPRRYTLVVAALALGAGCQLLVDPDPSALGNGGELVFDGGFTPPDASSEGDGNSVRDSEIEPEDGAVVEDSGPSTTDAGASCSNLSCPSNTYCDDSSGSPACVALPSCEGIKCAAGTSCELVDVLCFRAPCPPLPQCVKTAICIPGCSAGRHCELILGLSACVSDNSGTGSGDASTAVKCGKNTCSSGQECCNASCGTCVQPGRACSQIACN